MPLQKLEFRPGLNREGTDYSNEGGWYDGDKIRFRSGFPEKIGGWSRLSNLQYIGTCRAIWNWIDLDGANYLGIGTNKKYYIEYGGSYNDITPIVLKNGTALAPPHQLAANPIATTSGSRIVTITDGNYNPQAGDYVIITSSATVGGLSINGEYVVVAAPLSTTFTIDAGSNASSTATGGGTVLIEYEYPIGLDVSTVGTGWGTGPWGRGGWGSSYSAGILRQLRLWTNDNYGQDLAIAPRGGAICYWEDSGGITTRAKLLSELSTTKGFNGQYVPIGTNQILVSPIQRFLIAMGANSYVSGDPATPFNPMLVRWSDQENPYQWVPDITNQSGEFPLSNGSFIMQAQATRQEILIWTDSCLYSMQYLGAPYVWGFQILMDNISIMSPKCAVTVNNVTYWMGREKFYMYSGTVQTLPCSLRQFIFEDINSDQGFQVFAGSNEGYNEVWWFYVSNENTNNTIDRYVIYNYLDRVWYYGTMARTAWLDSGIRPYPMAANYENRILYHESAVDDVSGLTPVPIEAYVQSSDFDIGDGHNFGFVWRILPDVNFNGSIVNNPSVTMTVRPRQNSGTPYGAADSPVVQSYDNYANSKVYNIQQFDGQVYTRLRGRQMAFRIESTGLGVSWQLGTPRIDIRNDGRR